MSASNRIEIVASGIAECIEEPMTKAGLEGYDRGDRYRFQECRMPLPGIPYRKYYRLFPDDDLAPEHYETCTPRVFGRFFRVVVEVGDG